MTVEEARRTEQSSKAIEVVRTCLREMRRPQADFPRLNGDLRKAIDTCRRRAEEVSSIVFDQRVGHVKHLASDGVTTLRRCLVGSHYLGQSGPPSRIGRGKLYAQSA